MILLDNLNAERHAARQVIWSLNCMLCLCFPDNFLSPCTTKMLLMSLHIYIISQTCKSYGWWLNCFAMLHIATFILE